MVEDNLIQAIHNKKINLTEDDVLERLLDRFRWPKFYPWKQRTVEVIADVDYEDLFLLDGYLDSQKVIKFYEEGYTLIISNSGNMCKDTWIIQQLLNRAFNKNNINCNLYFSKGLKDISYDKHHHDYQVIVKNILGKSKWIIDEKEVLLDNQDCIWFDKFTEHQVVEISDAKLSMTCNIE